MDFGWQHLLVFLPLFEANEKVGFFLYALIYVKNDDSKKPLVSRKCRVITVQYLQLIRFCSCSNKWEMLVRLHSLSRNRTVQMWCLGDVSLVLFVVAFKRALTEDTTQWLSVTVAKHLLIQTVQSKGFICQSHAANKQAPGVQCSLSWQGQDGKLILRQSIP